MCQGLLCCCHCSCAAVIAAPILASTARLARLAAPPGWPLLLLVPLLQPWPFLQHLPTLPCCCPCIRITWCLCTRYCILCNCYCIVCCLPQLPNCYLRIRLQLASQLPTLPVLLIGCRRSCCQCICSIMCTASASANARCAAGSASTSLDASVVATASCLLQVRPLLPPPQLPTLPILSDW